MFTLETTNTIAADGDASVGSYLTYTIFGMELVGSVETYKVLAQGTVASSATTIYTTPTSTTSFIKTITVVNTDLTASHTVQFFVGGTADANAISPALVLPAGGSVDYEDGTGWSVTTIEAGTTLLNDIHTGYQEWNDISNPSVPTAGVLRMYARKISGRMIPKWTPPSGLDTPIQPALFGNQVVLFTPYNSTTVTPNGFGAIWAKGGSAGTVSTPTIATTSPTFLNSMRRTRHANAATTTNQAMGIIANANASRQFWLGSGAGLGGFFFFARFGLGLWLDNSRIFVGLGGSATERVVSDTLTANTIGLWRDTTMTGDVLKFVTVDNSAAVNTIDVPGASVATGSCFDVYIFHKGSNDGTIYFRVDQIDLGGSTLIDSSTSSNMPSNTVFFGPEVEVSNGTANTTVTTVAMDVNRIYVESDH